MADLKSIEYPDHLNRHTLTEQELSALTDSQKALAKDWNIINRKVDWIILHLVEQHNLLVEHDKLLDTWKRVLWLIGLLAASGGFIGAVVKITWR